MSIATLSRPLQRPRHLLRQALYVVGFPVFSLFSGRVGFTLFFRRQGRWYARTRGQTFPVRTPNLRVLEYFRHFVPRSGEVVFDVGGEFGLETELFARMVGPTGKVLVFECMPHHVAHLERLAAGLPAVEIVNVACWDKPCELKFHAGHTPGSNTAVPDARGQSGQALANAEGETFMVRADTLDNLWKRLHQGRPVDFLKMDIEGAEYEALAGATEMLQHTRRAVIAAYHIRDGVATAARVAEQMRAAGFQVRTDENLHVYAWR